MLTGADLVGGSTDYVWCEKIESSYFVLRSILVEEAPQAALRLVFNLWKLIKVWKMEVRRPGESAGHGREAVLGLLKDRAFFAVAHVYLL